MVEIPSCDKLNLKRGAKILTNVSKHSAPKKAGLKRCVKSCRPMNFTPQDEEMIIKLHATIGSRWSIIAQLLPGRTDKDVKNYWNTKLQKKLSKMGIDPVTHKSFSQILADFGNISGLPRLIERIGSPSRDMSTVTYMEPEQHQSSTQRLDTSPVLKVYSRRNKTGMAKETNKMIKIEKHVLTSPKY